MCLGCGRPLSCISNGSHHLFTQTADYLRRFSFFFGITGIICQLSRPTPPELYFYDWCTKRQLPNTANGCHSSLNREGDTEINNLPHYCLPVFILILHVLVLLPLLVHAVSLLIHRTAVNSITVR